MPKGVKPPITFQGKKGKSGRKSARVEFARNNVIKKSWNILDTRLEDVDDIGVALPIALKDMVERKDITSGGKPIPLLQGITKENDTNNSPDKTPATQETD